MRRLGPQLPPVLPRISPTVLPPSVPGMPPHPPPAREPVPRRRAAIAACDCCRKRKIKCNAKRPACDPCVAGNKACSYFTKPSESRVTALKRKHSELQQRVDCDAIVLEWLRVSAPEDAQRLVRRIQQSEDSSSIVRDVQHGALLLQLSRGAPRNASSSGSGSGSSASPNPPEPRRP